MLKVNYFPGRVAEGKHIKMYLNAEKLTFFKNKLEEAKSL